mmetsp:Transcript_50431/g.114479  ORF Transcript_50431/g.114479 Transcript_50431/m.114479 type:complete len:253 (+) Transcript_50431:110-868(+)
MERGAPPAALGGSRHCEATSVVAAAAAAASGVATAAGSGPVSRLRPRRSSRTRASACGRDSWSAVRFTTHPSGSSTVASIRLRRERSAGQSSSACLRACLTVASWAKPPVSSATWPAKVWLAPSCRLAYALPELLTRASIALLASLSISTTRSLASRLVATSFSRARAKSSATLGSVALPRRSRYAAMSSGSPTLPSAPGLPEKRAEQETPPVRAPTRRLRSTSEAACVPSSLSIRARSGTSPTSSKGSPES